MTEDFTEILIFIFLVASNVNNLLFLLLKGTRPKVLMALVDLGLHASPVDRQLVLSTFDQAIATFSNEQKLKYVQRKLEFVEDYGESIDR